MPPGAVRVAPKGGNVGKGQRVLLEDGSKLRVSAQGRFFWPQAALTLTEARRVQRADLARRDASIRAIVRRHSKGFFDKLTLSDKNRRLDGELRISQRMTLRVLARKAAADMEMELAEHINEGFGLSARRDLRAHLKENNVNLGGDQRTQLISTVLDDLYSEPFPGTEFTSGDRVYMNMRVVERRLMQLVDARPDDLAEQRRKVRHSLYGREGRTRLPGGSPWKAIQRIQRTEQARASRAIALAVAREFGIPLAYWRLSPAHKWYGGQEICEQLAATTGPGVRDLIRSSGREVASFDIVGLHTIDQFPHIPHPNCMCMQELAALS